MKAGDLNVIDELYTPHPATGCRFMNVAEVYFFRVVHGRIAEVWGLEDTTERLRQLGLSSVTDPDVSR